MQPRQQNKKPVALLLEKHPLRNQLYRKYIEQSGYEVQTFPSAVLLGRVALYKIAVVSIPDEVTEHPSYYALLTKLPDIVPCVVLSTGHLPPLFNNCLQIVRHINRSESHPQELIRVVTMLSLA